MIVKNTFKSYFLFLFFIFGFIFFPSVKVKAFDFTQPTEIIENIGSGDFGAHFDRPKDVHVNTAGDIYVSDEALNKIFKYDLSENNWESLGSYGSELGQFNSPGGIKTDDSGHIYVADTNNGRIQIYSAQDENWSSIGNKGSGLGFFRTPTQIALDSQNNIYVYDSYYRTIQKYNQSSEEWFNVSIPSLNYMTSFYIDNEDNIYLFDSANDKGVHKYDAQSTTWSFIDNSNILGIVSSITTDNDHNIYIALSSAIGKYNLQTQQWSYLSQHGSEVGSLDFPAGMSYHNGYLYIADWQNSRVQRYNLSSEEWIDISTLGDNDNRIGDFSLITNMTLDDSDNLYLYGKNNEDIYYLQKYNQSNRKWSVLFDSSVTPTMNMIGDLVVLDNGDIYANNVMSSGINYYNNQNKQWSLLFNSSTYYGICKGEGEELYVTDAATGLIKKYEIGTTTWTPILDTSSHLNPTQIPIKITYDTQGIIFIGAYDNNTSNFSYYSFNVNTLSNWQSIDTGVTYGSASELTMWINMKSDNNNNLYIPNNSNHQIHKYNFNSDSLLTYGTQGSSPGQFKIPTQIAIDRYDNVYVVDHQPVSRIQKLWYYDLVQYSTSDNGYVFGATTQKLSNGQRGTYVIAVPKRGHVFQEWSDGLSSAIRRDIGGSGPVDVTAIFTNRRSVSEITQTLFADEVTQENISIASTNPASTPSFTFNTNYTFKAGDAEIVFPADTVVTSTEGGNLDLTQFATTENTDTVKAVLTQALAAVQVGIPNEKLTFSKAITITIPVGASYNGQTLEIKYKREGEDTWNVEGTCVVASGNCTFQTTHATTFAALEPVTSSSNESNSSNATSVSVSSTPDHSCHSSKPLFTSDLFQINTTTNSAKIYFTPQADTNNYVISFSTNPNAEEHGEQVSLLREGVQSHTIYYLKPNTTYYVKVRGQNACMPGEWSNIMKFKTNSTIYYKSGLTTFVSNVKSLVKNTVTKKTDTTTKTDDLKEDKINISTDTSSNQTNDKTVETTSSTNQQTTETPKAKKCFLWWCW